MARAFADWSIMPTNTLAAAGRLVPASQLEFARYAKNLAWLLETPLHLARELLAACYGFSSLHELQVLLPSEGQTNVATGPFHEPRLRPPFFEVEVDREVPNALAPLSVLEMRLLDMSLRVLGRREEEPGRLRRRHYAVLDGAFFSVPSVHRKHFSLLKAGILAMEGTEDDRERYLEAHWPTGFWAFLEGIHMDPVVFKAGPVLDKLAENSRYFGSTEPPLNFSSLFQETAAHRAPAIFIEMAGRGNDEASDSGYDYGEEFDAFPSISSYKSGLYSYSDGEDWAETLSELVEGLSDDLVEELYGLKPEQIARNPPEGTPVKVVDRARGWRLACLRRYCQQYVDSNYVTRTVAVEGEMFWPGSPGNTVTEVEPLVLHISRNAPSLMLYTEFSERSREDEEMSRGLWRFRTVLARVAPGEPDEVVGYLAGWHVELTDGKMNGYACDLDELRSDAGYISTFLERGLHAFEAKYFAYEGLDGCLDYVNSSFNTSVVICEIFLMDKFRGMGLAELAFEGYASSLSESRYSGMTEGWKSAANFDTDMEDVGDGIDNPSFDLATPGVFLVPVDRGAKRLRKHLLSMELPGEFGDDDQPQVFPFNNADPEGEVNP